MKSVDSGPRLKAWRKFALPWQERGRREGFLLQWRWRLPDGTERMGWGEASPLPGWSSDTLEEVAEGIAAAVRGERPWRKGLPPAVRWSQEMALGQATDWEGWPSPRPQVPVAVLLTGSPSTWPEKTLRARAQGARTLKLKISPATAVQALEFLAWLDQQSSALAPPALRVRLDANQSFSLEEVLAFARKVPAHRLAFWEEPLRESRDWTELQRRCRLPWALDETLRCLCPEALAQFPGVVALVCKPMLLGGWQAYAPWVEAGRSLGMRPVVSASFESGVGLTALAQLAARLPEEEAAGLDTYASLEQDVLRQRLDFSRYQLAVEALPAADPAQWHPPTAAVWLEVGELEEPVAV